MDQSFLRGVQGLEEVPSAAGGAEFKELQRTGLRVRRQATTATVLPNTLSAMYRSHREHLPDTRVTKDMGILKS